VVADQYLAFGGISPINDQNQSLCSALAAELSLGVPASQALPVYWGNRNWDPLLADTLRQMRADGIGSAAVVVTSGYSSYSGCRQYRENMFDAVQEVESDGGGAAPRLIKIRRWFDQPAFIEVMAENVVRARAQLPELVESPRLVFTTHSIPIRQAQSSGAPHDGGDMYLRQHQFAAGAIASRVDEITGEQHEWDLVFQSRSGRPTVPWLDPDISDHFRAIADEASGVVIVPIGFASDHMEVMWDLDTLAMGTAKELDLPAVRVATVGDDPRFVAALADLVRERVEATAVSERPALGPWGPAPDRCVARCCPNPNGPRPAMCGSDQ